MTFKEKIELLKRFDYYVSNKCTGKPDELAEKMKTSRRTIFRLVKAAEFFGAEVDYDSRIESYCYKKKGCLRLCFEEFNNENYPPPYL